MWNTVCFNLDGETVNFGPRNELLGGSELYEACTLFTIGIGAGVNSVSHQPPVHAVTTSGYFAIAIENVVNVMRHQTTVLSRTFESTVDCIALRSDVASGVLLAGERLGILHVVLVESSKIVSFRVGKTPSDGDTKLFRSIEVRKADDDDVYNVFVLAGDNMIVATISDEILSQLDAATKEPDLTPLQVRVVNLGQKISAKDTMFPSTAARWVDDDLLVSSSPGDLYCFSIGEKRSYRLLSGLSKTGVSKMFAVQSDCSLLVLNAEKELLVLCLKTLIIKRTWSEMGIDDFMVSEDAALSCEAETDQGLKIAVLTVLNGDAPRKLKICRYSTSELLYSLEVEEFCWLATVGHDQEDFCIVEGTADKDWGGIAELRVRVVSEALPEQRLAKLIGKQKFLEAEEFARLYELPLEEVHWNHLLFVLDELGGLRQSPLDETSERARLEEAYSLIRQLPDALRVARCCVETQIATPSAVVGLFLFLQEHLSATECPDCAERDALCAEIASLLNRVTTYRLLQLNQTMSGWLSFSRADLLQEMSSCFRNEDVPSALLIWARHQDQFVASLDREAVLFLLNAVPSTMRVSVLVGWLEESFLPCILQNVPEAVQDVCLWIVSRALSIELYEKAAWPSGAVKLLEVVPNVYNQMTSCADILPSKSWLAVYSAPRMIQREEGALCKLYYLLTNLRDLEVLWIKYKCRVTLPELQNPNILEAVFSILDEVVTKTEVDVLLEGFLLPYLKRKELDVSETLSNYVERTLRYHEIPLLQEAPWEEKLLAVSKFVHHPNHWLKIAVKILSHAPVPWSKGMEELAEQGSLLQGHAIEAIETERKRMQVNVILQRYDMKFMRCTQLSDARVLIRNILLSEKPMALEDALTVAKSMGNLTELEVCLFHMERLLLKGDIDKFADALHSVPPDTLRELGPRMATFGRLHLSRNFASCGGKAKELMECWQYLLTVLYTKQEIKLEDYSSMQNQVLQIITLWWDYEIKVPIANLESAGGRHGVLQECLQRLDFQRSAEDTPQRTSRRLLHLADVLKLNVQSALEALVSKALDLGRDDLLQVFCGCLLEVPRLHSSVLETLHKILCKSKDVLGVISKVHEIACRVSLTVKGSLLTRCTKILMWADLLMQILDACDATNVSPLRLADPYLTWKQRRMYERQGGVLEREEIVSNINSLGKAMWHLLLEHKIELLDIVKQKLKLLCNHFCSRSQDELCISLLVTVEHAFHDSLHSATIYEVIKGMNTQADSALFSMLARAVAQKHLDMLFVKSLLFSLGSKQAMATSLETLFSLCNGSFGLLKELAMVCCWMSHGPLQQKFKAILKGAYWGHRLKRSSICFAEAMKGDRTALESVLSSMITCLSVDTEDIVNYCRSFSLNSESALAGRLEFLLCTQAEEDFLRDRPLSKTLTDAAIVLEALPKASALKALKKALAKVNSYCYEVLQFGYDYLDGCRNWEEPTSNVQRELHVLQFLASYRRHGSPSEHEMDVWYDEHPSVDLPAVSRTRLPFHLLLQPSSWKFINNEIHPDTASAWMDVADILRLDKDDILFMAVENAVVLWSCQKHGGSILDVNFLVSIKSLLDQMSSLDKFLACLGMMLKKLAKGPTAVRAAKTCADLPLSRLGQNSKEAKDRKAKFTRLYMQLRNEQILKHHSIDTSPYLGLCSKTEQLLEKLLECSAWHSLFADTSRIYNCLSQIAESYAPGSLMFHTIVERKVEKWLQCCAPESPLDQTFQTLTFEISSRNDRDDSADLIALIHLIQYIPEQLKNLLNKILSVGNNPLGLQRQVLARKCLLAGFGDSTDGCTAISIGELRMNSYRAMLQRLGVPLDIQELNQQSATELATSLLSVDCRSREILRVISALCIEFKVQLLSIWDALLSSATKLNAVEVLCQALPTAGRFPLLWQSSEFMSAWRCVLLAPSHLYEVSSKKNKLLQASLALRCPSVHRLPFTLMFDDCRDEGGIVLFVVYTLLRGLGDVTQQMDELFGSLPTEAFTILQAHKDHFFMNLLHIGKVLEK
ncbi:hypothetical protein HPB47_009711 [Ixodes persulcatus]|uniref:Uncharacterized protein n=1 Tax=Ixodes persulcatus TaxID=34615 RepID=A0AC60P122_IXOPE|nr:hypothetical protein HPB47_009711 [Ixodes persulcatus]